MKYITVELSKNSKKAVRGDLIILDKNGKGKVVSDSDVDKIKIDYICTGTIHNKIKITSVL